MTRTTPASATREHVTVAETWSAHNYAPLPVVLSRGEGCWVWDVDGRRYLDMLSAYSALNQGHRHPRILDALREQAGRITLTSRAFHNDQMGPFLRELCEATGFEKALPMNTGAEAVETAIKAARKWGYRHKGVPEDRAEIIVCENNFHGRTTTIVGFSTEDQYRDGFGPFTPGFREIPFGDADALEAAIGENTVAFLMEPIQGEGGVVVPPEGWLARCAELCRRHDVLLLNDEIQTGLGRTGRLFCGDWDGERGDVLIVGKALGGGVYPVSAILADEAPRSGAPRCRSCSRRSCRGGRRSSGAGSWRSCRPSTAPTSTTSAVAVSWSASWSRSPRGRPGPSARPSWSAGSSPRRPTAR